jgi:chromosome segregation ATPase
MENWREQLHVLLVSETTYADIKCVPVEQRTLREYVQSKVFELMNGAKQDMEAVRKESDMYKENLDRTTHQLDRARHDLEVREQEHRETLRELQSQLETYREKSDRLTHELTTSSRNAREGHSKGEMFDRVKDDHDELQSQFLSLQRNHDALSASHALLQEQKKSIDASATQQQHELEILRMDKVLMSNTFSCSTFYSTIISFVCCVFPN